jgi:hypothetical protein
LCFIQKIRRRSLDDVAFAGFNRNPNFVLVESSPVKKKSIFIFIFNCVLFKKIRRRSLDDVAFAGFDRNPNFVLAGSHPVKKIQFLFLFLIVFYSKKLEGDRLMM